MLVARDEPTLKKDVLDRHIRPIVTMARGLKGDVPGIGVLVMVKANGSKQSFLDGTTSFARKAEIYKEVLVEHGMPADVIEALDSAIVAYRESIDSRGGARGDYCGNREVRCVAGEVRCDFASVRCVT